MKKIVCSIVIGLTVILTCSVEIFAKPLSMSGEQREAYKNVVEQAEQQYGEYTLIDLGDIQYAKGVNYLELNDINEDGNPELLLVYNDGEVSEFGTPTIESYQYELWTYEENEAVMLESDGLYFSNGGFPSVCWTEYGGKKYLVTNYQNAESDWFHGFKEDGSFGVVDTYLFTYTDNGTATYINGELIDSETWIAERQSCMLNSKSISLYYQDGNNVFDTVQEVKSILEFD